MVPKSPTKTIEPYAPVSPYSSDGSNASTASSRSVIPGSPARRNRARADSSSNNYNNNDELDGLEEEFGKLGEKIVMSDHRRAESEGRHAEEPLLKENPGRFVLFPIKEPEVSRLDVLQWRWRLSCHHKRNNAVHKLCHFCHCSHKSSQESFANRPCHCRSGKCTKRPKPPSGLPKRLT